MYDARTKLGLAVALLVSLSSAMLWNHLHRGRMGAAPPAPADRLVVFRLGGETPPASRARRGAPPARRAAPPPHRNGTPAVVATPRRYEVRKGDCLTLISQRVYGRSARWKEIAAANGIREPWTVVAGQVLTIP